VCALAGPAGTPAPLGKWSVLRIGPRNEMDGPVLTAARQKGKTKRLEYQVKWKELNPDDELYPARNFKNAPVAIEEFHERNPEAPGPPVNLRNWVKAAAQNEKAEGRQDDDVAQKDGIARKKRATRHV
jgi:hypothetical protein